MPIQIKTVVIVEDSYTSRERLRARLSATPGVVLIGEYQNMEQATAGMALVAPDAAVIEVKAGDTYSMELLRFLKNRHPQTTVIVYSSEAGAGRRSSYAEAGADMFFDKANETEQMLAALSQLSTH